MALESARDAGVALFIDPPSHHFLDDVLFRDTPAHHTGDDVNRPFRMVRDHFSARGIPVHTADRLPAAPDGRRNVYLSLGIVADYPRLAARPDVVLSAFIGIECPIVEPSIYAAWPAISRHVRRLMSYTDAESLLPFTGQPVPVERYVWPQPLDGIHEAAWSREDRGFLTMINANKLPRLYRDELYTKRLEAVAFFHRHGEIDLYGKGWGRAPMRVGKSWVPWTIRRYQDRLWEWRQRRFPDPVYAAVAAAWKGTVDSKADTLSRYRFSLCFENMVLPGWITEKIFDCLAAGSIPVYWGAPEIRDVIPPECFVDMREFRDYAELRRFLQGLSPDEVRRYREAGRDFMQSDRLDRFRPGAFVDLVRRIVREDTGVEC